MSFIDGLRTYFTVVLDLSSFLMGLFVSIGCCIFCLPKVIDKREVLKLSLIFLISYAICILFPSLTFAIVTTIPDEGIFQQMIYSVTMPLIIGTFALIFTKGTKQHIFIKTSILVAISNMVMVMLSTSLELISKIHSQFLQPAMILN